MSSFELNSSFKPSGDQEQAIGKLLKSLEAGNKHQALLGVTGSGKTFTMANLIARMNRPTLVISHNKTLAAQLHSELKSFFPNNAVDYYVSYFDYYQPEAYIASTDTYIEKDSAINDELDRLSLNAMNSLMTRRDVIVVASVSCIYGLSTPEDYRNLTLRIREGDIMDRDVFLRQLVERLFERQDFDFLRGTFRVRGEVVEVFPAYSEGEAIRVEFFGDEVERVSLIDSVSGRVRERLGSYTFFPAKQYVAAPEKRAAALKAIRQELADRVTWFEKEGRLLEAQRLKLASEMGRKQTDSVFVFDEPTIEFSYKNDELGDPLMNAYHAIALKAATREEIETIKAMAFKVNEVMKQYFDTLNVILVDFKLEFGKTADGKIVLADEISPDTCRLWDKTTKEKLDKDRFRRDMGGVEEAYQEIMKRVMGK